MICPSAHTWHVAERSFRFWPVRIQEEDHIVVKANGEQPHLDELKDGRRPRTCDSIRVHVLMVLLGGFSPRERVDDVDPISHALKVSKVKWGLNRERIVELLRRNLRQLDIPWYHHFVIKIPSLRPYLDIC